MHDVGVPKMEFEMPMSGVLPRLCFEKKMVGAQCLEPVKVRKPSIMSFLKRLRFL